MNVYCTRYFTITNRIWKNGYILTIHKLESLKKFSSTNNFFITKFLVLCKVEGGDGEREDSV